MDNPAFVSFHDQNLNDLHTRSALKTAADVADKDGIQPADSGDTSVEKHAFEGDDPQKCAKCGLAKTAAAHQGQSADEG